MTPSSSSTAAAGSALPARTACEACRSRKLKCDGAAQCKRCVDDGRECVYAVRAPIGRPKKRKGQFVAPSAAAAAASPSQGSSSSSSRRASGSPMQQRNNDVPDRKRSRSNTARPADLTAAAAAATTTMAHMSPRPFVLPEESEQPAQRASCCSGGNAAAASAMQTSPASSSSGVASPVESPMTQLSASESNSTASSAATTASAGLTGSTSSTNINATVSPSLDNLAIAAFLESLDELEISSSDGLTPGIIDAWPFADQSGASSSSHLGIGGSSSSSRIAPLTHIDPHSLAPGATDSAVDPSVSYAVPADFSWWSPEWLAGLAPPPPQQQQQHETFNAASPAMGGPTLAPSPWPRGREGGMGGGEIRTADGEVVHGTAWPETQTQGLTGATTNEAAQASSAQQGSSEEAEEGGACRATGAAVCCCKGKEKATEPIAPSSSQPSTSTRTSRVHCVPNPSGKGCTCLCDVSVSLLNVRASLRTTSSTAQPVSQTLHLTLAASQAVAAQCACSADCPTCRSDPSTSLSAGLLISTALQIYARAVSTLRLALGGGTSGEGNEPDALWDMKIGAYTPSARNARRIALFAMKLELRDLREAIGKVSWAAEGGAGAGGADPLCINPVDQLVIRKLHQQLGEVLRTVEGME